jgi:cell division protein FtsW (lipid II flippase)
MKFPSLKNLAEGAVSTIKRYPFEVLFALAGTIAATTEIELRQIARENEGWCIRVIMIANLGLLLSLSATLYTQSVAMAKSKKLVLKIAVAVFAALLIFIIDPTHRTADYTRFFLMSLAMHLLVAFAAFTGKGQLQGSGSLIKPCFCVF